MKATVYIPDDEYRVYEEAREKLGESISSTFLRCLKNELEVKKQTHDRIVVKVLGQGDMVVKKAFEGRWIIGSEAKGGRFDWSDNEGVTFAGGFEGYSVAVTKAGRIVVVSHDQNQNAPGFEVFDDYE